MLHMIHTSRLHYNACDASRLAQCDSLEIGTYIHNSVRFVREIVTFFKGMATASVPVRELDIRKGTQKYYKAGGVAKILESVLPLFFYLNYFSRTYNSRVDLTDTILFASIFLL